MKKFRKEAEDQSRTDSINNKSICLLACGDEYRLDLMLGIICLMIRWHKPMPSHLVVEGRRLHSRFSNKIIG